jgi:hypothetical protein
VLKPPRQLGYFRAAASPLGDAAENVGTIA